MTDIASIRRLARATGLIYVVLIVFGMFAPIVLETLLVPGDAAATAGSVLGSMTLFRISLLGWIVIVVADVVLSVILYLLFETASRTLSMVSAAFRAVYTTLLAAFLVRLFSGYSLLAGSSLGTAEVHDLALRDFETFSAGFSLALVFFGVHLILFGTLLKRSKYVPTALSILLIVAGVGYVADSLAKFFVPSHGDLASMLLLTPALL
ncbi:MAG: DUF4386 domain-containing protein, partial [Gemmatimonadota bacterium]|nr:DUF4386 domain-containing protein [Gemmatimonadota bacterium]